MAKASLSAADAPQVAGLLAGLNGGDIQSLNASLKNIGIDVDAAVLEMSESMKDRVEEYASEFIRPLVLHIFSEHGRDLHGRDALRRLFRDPDVARVRKNLKLISDKTGVPVNEIPEFLEDYCALCLCAAYYRYTYECLAPELYRFLRWTAELQHHREVFAAPAGMASCSQAGESSRFLVSSIRERLAQLRDEFELFWCHMSGQSFRRLRRQVEENRTGTEAVMYSLAIKMRAWSSAFPANGVGRPAARLAYLAAMLPGLERLRTMESDDRLLRYGSSPFSEKQSAGERDRHDLNKAVH